MTELSLTWKGQQDTPRLRGVFWTEMEDKARTRMAQRMLAWMEDPQGWNLHALTKEVELDITSGKTFVAEGKQ